MDYFITGSTASNFYGIPRLTHDIDIVVKFTGEREEDFFQAFETDSYISRDGITEAMSGSGMFNVIDNETCFKTDFWIFKNDPFGASCFKRSRKVPLALDCSGNLVSPEDIVLHKLLWNSITPSERQVRDAMGVVIVQGDSLDRDYLRIWARALHIEAELEMLLNSCDLPNVT
jgi:hypothetical protein